QRLSVDRAGLGSTGERGRAIPDIPAVLREHPGQAGGRTKGSLGEPPEDRPACARGDLVVVAMLYRGVVVAGPGAHGQVAMGRRSVVAAGARATCAEASCDVTRGRDGRTCDLTPIPIEATG